MQNNFEIPPVVIPTHLDLVQQLTTKCSNGINLHTLKSDSASVVRLSLVFKGGSSVQEKPFAAASTLSMLAEGTEDFSAEEIAEKLDFYGIFFDNSTDRDYCYITIAALTKFLHVALSLLESMLLRPAFLESEFDLYRGKKRQQLQIDRAKPSFMAREAFATNLFGSEHPYGRFSVPEKYDELTVADLKEYHRENFHAECLEAVASGEISEGVRSEIEAFLNKIPQLPTEQKAVDFPAIATNNSTITIEREDSVQSCIRMGSLTVDKSHADFIPLQLLTMVLGGYFGSRLVQNLRETHGYTYGAYSGIVTLTHCGYLAIATDVDKEHTDDAIREIRSELKRLQDELIPEEELYGAVSTITGELMRLIDGPFGIADIAIENLQSGLSPEYLNEFLERISQVTPTELQEIAVKYFDANKMLTVVVG